MAKINDIKNIIASAAAKNNVPAYENGNNALKVAESVIPLPNNNTVPVTKPTTDVQPTPQQALKAFIKANLREGIDYGQIPGLGNKNQLFKPGAAKIINFLRLRPQVQLLHTVFDPETKAISYTVKVALINEEGIVVTEALGASNTLEPKFAKAGMGAQNLVVSQSVKRATISAVKNLIC
jgi:hypothetical protein